MENAIRLRATTKSILTNLVSSQNKVKQEQNSQDISEEATRRNRYGKIAITLALVLFFLVMLKNAWVSDDGYITLRTVYNFIHGYGLTWNVGERVDTFTHPLWMFLESGAYFLVRDTYFSSLLLSLSISTLAIALFAFRLMPSPFVAIVGVAILTASKSFIDFSTSGLENPVTHLLIVLFVLVFFQYQQSKHYLLWLSLLGSAMVLNRMDTLLLFLPALLYAWYRAPQSKLKALMTIILAFLPFIAWEIFSLFYYGFLFPNTAYAKLNTGISTSQLLKQGIEYLISSTTFDPLLFIILVSVVLLIVARQDWKSVPLLLGLLLYIAYVVKVGGDFMAGRFLTPPFLMAVILLLRNIPSSAKIFCASILAIVVIIGFFVPNSRWYTINSNTQLIDSNGVADEHAFYADATGLINFQRDGSMPDVNFYSSRFGLMALQARQQHEKLIVAPAIGIAGYEAGSQVYVLDPLALGDPLLARLPLSASELGNWRIGHFERTIPPGYLETLETGTNRIQDPGLAAYYIHLHDVISGPLFDGQRLLEIWKFNIGAYNSLLQHYIQTLSAQSHMPQHLPTSPSSTLFSWVAENRLMFAAS